MTVSPMAKGMPQRAADTALLDENLLIECRPPPRPFLATQREKPAFPEAIGAAIPEAIGAACVTAVAVHSHVAACRGSCMSLPLCVLLHAAAAAASGLVASAGDPVGQCQAARRPRTGRPAQRRCV